MEWRTRLLACLCAALGAGAAVGTAACGDDERGGVEVEGASTGAGTGTADMTTGTGTVGTTTAPETVETSPTEPGK